MPVRFACADGYSDRPGKARYVARKYQEILRGAVLDVGADRGHLRDWLPAGTAYTGIDFSGHPGIVAVDLEREAVPFPDAAFDAVLCLDVLEHLNNLHRIFDEVCRVSRHWVILSLPNPWASFLDHLVNHPVGPVRPLQHYGLPLEPVPDRHKWFFSASEARAFVAERAARNGLQVVQVDSETPGEAKRGWARGLEALAWWRRRCLLRRLCGSASPLWDLEYQTQWWVLEKTRQPGPP